MFVDTLRFDDFYTKLTVMFGKDCIDERDVKVVFRKITTNPDAAIDWCEVSYT